MTFVGELWIWVRCLFGHKIPNGYDSDRQRYLVNQMVAAYCGVVCRRCKRRLYYI